MHRFRGENKRCHMLSTETMPKPPPIRSNALFIGISVILACRQLAVKINFTSYASNGRNAGVGTISTR